MSEKTLNVLAFKVFYIDFQPLCGKVVGEVDGRYQSVNVEMCEVVGGDFWIPYEQLDPLKVAAEGWGCIEICNSYTIKRKLIMKKINVSFSNMMHKS